MHDDFVLAADLLGGSRRAARAFERRFGPAVEHALDHAPDAGALGLTLAAYADGVARSAARSLLGSLPATLEDAALDPHVHRVLRHRDFALGLLLSRGDPGAWSVFRERFGTYVRSLFIRSGRIHEADRLLEELIAELSRPRADSERRPIEGYAGRFDLTNWLFGYVRVVFQGGLRPSDVVPPLPAAPGGEQPIVDPDLRRRLAEVFAELERDLAPRDRRLTVLVARGASVRALAASGALLERGRPPGAQTLLARHRRIVANLFRGLVDHIRSSGTTKESREAVEQRIQDTLMTELASELAPICGTDT